jgi:hypothetical protein
MRKSLILLSTIALAACNFSAEAEKGEAGSGRQAKQTFTVGDFDGVALAGSQNVVVTVGGATSVRAEGDADAIENMEIKVEDGTLRIGTKKGMHWGFGTSHSKVTVYVTTPRLANAAVAGSGDMRVDRVEGEKFTGSIAGSGNLDIASLKVAAAEFSVAGSGDVKAAGSAGAMKVSIAGSGDVDMKAVESKTAKVAVVGSGDVQAHATDTADVTIMGSGNVSMAGSAKCTVSKHGSGDVTCGA